MTASSSHLRAARVAAIVVLGAALVGVTLATVAVTGGHPRAAVPAAPRSPTPTPVPTDVQARWDHLAAMAQLPSMEDEIATARSILDELKTMVDQVTDGAMTWDAEVTSQEWSCGSGVPFVGARAWRIGPEVARGDLTTDQQWAIMEGMVAISAAHGYGGPKAAQAPGEPPRMLITDGERGGEITLMMPDPGAALLAMNTPCALDEDALAGYAAGLVPERWSTYDPPPPGMSLRPSSSPTSLS